MDSAADSNVWSKAHANKVDGDGSHAGCVLYCSGRLISQGKQCVSV